jgi:hypothetical protein
MGKYATSLVKYMLFIHLSKLDLFPFLIAIVTCKLLKDWKF